MLIYTNDVYSESAELIADSNVVVLDVRPASSAILHPVGTHRWWRQWS